MRIGEVMTVKELYEEFSKKIPGSLSEEWDNDGLMCSADTSSEVMRVLCTLDVTDEVVDYAIEGCFDLIVSHHPLIFKPIRAVNDEDHIARKVIRLIESGVSVFSFHTRADKVAGGVNDRLCDLLGIYDTSSFGEGELGRIGNIDEEMSLEDFAYRVKQATGSDVLKYADGYNTVKTVAVVGGDGKDFVRDAILSGADTYVSGRISYNIMEEASELGINLIEAGHYHTEAHISEYFRELLLNFDPDLYVETAQSNLIKFI